MANRVASFLVPFELSDIDSFRSPNAFSISDFWTDVNSDCSASADDSAHGFDNYGELLALF